MQIGITNPLREFLKWKPFPPNGDEAPIFCWDAHRVKVDGRVMLVVCNAANRFSGVTAARATDWKHLDEACVNLVRQSMLSCGFSPPAVDEYLSRAGAVEFGRTHGRKAVGCMNRMVDTLLWMQCDRDERYQAYMTYVVNAKDLASCSEHAGYGYAAERMAEDLKKLGIEPFQETDSTDQSPTPTADESPESTRVEDIAREVGSILDGFDAELDARLNNAFDKLGAVPIDANPNPSDINNRISDAIRIMRVEHGGNPQHPPADASLCTVCGAQPRVFLNNVPYCLNCYNELTERLMGVPHVTNDDSVLVVFDEAGATVQFAVERMITPPFARWSAREIVTEDNPSIDAGYAGIEVRIDAGLDEDQEETLAKLWEKAQEAVSRPSTYVHKQLGRGQISNGAHLDDGIHFANDSGWGHITEDEHGHPLIVIDGQRYNAEQFFGLFTGHIGFNLHWEMHDPADDLPAPWSMRQGFEQRGLI